MTTDDDESRVLKLVEDRLEMGRMKYGDLSVSQDGRNWTHEALEEALDMCVYLAAAILKIRDKPKPKHGRVLIGWRLDGDDQLTSLPNARSLASRWGGRVMRVYRVRRSGK